MPEFLKAVQISDSVYWVGAVDWNTRYFHGYKTGRGTTYNAYLITTDNITLVDTVKHGFMDEMMSRIASVVDPGKIKYIVSNHAEPDHSGSLPEVIEAVHPAAVFASKMGVKALAAHYRGNPGIEITAVNEGETLDLGGDSLTFMETRMVHWPDSMFSYMPGEKVLFSQDAFGMHLATSERFADELPWELLQGQSESYYANIITLYSPQVAKLLEKVAAAGLEFKVVAPDHGPVWRDMDSFARLLGLYGKWAKREFEPKVVIVYDTMWRATEKMARFIEEGARGCGVKVEVMSMSACHRSEVADHMLTAAGLIVGTPTMNNRIFPSMADILTYLAGLKFKTPYGAVFGSYGWSGEGITQAREFLETMGVEVLGEVKSQYAPDEEVMRACLELGRSVAEKVKQNF